MTNAHYTVYTISMKNITFSAKEEAIDKARKAAAKQHRTLNELFREWLENISHETGDEEVSDRLYALWKTSNYLCVGKKLSRDDLNER